MSKTARIDGRRVVDHDINGTPILEGKELPLPRYDIPTLEAIKSGWSVETKAPTCNKKPHAATGA